MIRVTSLAGKSCTFFVLLLLAIGPLSAATNDDFAKKLIGRWEGHVDVKQDRGRTLVIQSVKREGDQWIADARYGTTGGGLARVKIKTIVNGDDVALEFVSSANNPVKLKLAGEKNLEGTLTVFVNTKSGSDRSLKLTKVE